MKILLGGIPLGCSNIGDEAILACVVELMRELFPESGLTVCTARQEETAKLLSVATLPLYGFDSSLPETEFKREVRKFDLYLWCGATGLSDYPQVGIRQLRLARQAGVRTALWSVGMDSELNPAFFKAQGKKRDLLNALSLCTLKTVDFTAFYERRLNERMRRKIAGELRHCGFVTVRDKPSAEELKRCGFPSAAVSADSAIILKAAAEPPVARITGIQTIGICISAQKQLSDFAPLVLFLNQILEKPDRRILFIPMNPETDFELMSRLQQNLHRKEQTVLLKDCTAPADVQAAAGICDAVISSRLHLLILAANERTPIIGISRGSKVDNFLAEFGLKPAGSVRQCDFHFMRNELERFLTPEGSEEFKRKAEQVHAAMLNRLSAAKQLIADWASGDPHP